MRQAPVPGAGSSALHIHDLLQVAVEKDVSDLILTVGSQPAVRRQGKLERTAGPRLGPGDTETLLAQLLTEQQRLAFEERGEIRLSYSLFGTGRFRVNGFRQRGTVSIAIRPIPTTVPPESDLGLPEAVSRMALGPPGLVVACGPSGSGRSTTLASMVNEINSHRAAHVVTLEDPIEYLHRHNLALINQREIGSDALSLNDALRASLQQSVDVLMIGEMTPESTSQVLEIAARGVLVLAGVLAGSASEAIELIVDRFPPHRGPHVCHQLACTLRGAVCQQLVTRADGAGRVAAFEALVVDPGARELIRTARWNDLPAHMRAHPDLGSRTMADALRELLEDGTVSAAEYGARSAAA